MPTDETLDYDAIVIGSGVIGSAITLELARRGWRTLTVDKLPTAGYGSTSASSALMRLSYCTRAGVAMAYEGLRYWLDWPGYIGEVVDQTLAEYVNQPMLLPKTPGGHHEKVVPLFDRLGVAYEDLYAAETAARFPLVDLRIFGPPARLDDVDHPFWGEPDKMHDGVIVMPEAGYISDPQLSAQNLAAAAVAAGARFRFKTEVVSIERDAGRVSGITTADGDRITSRVVVNAAGPHARIINEMAGVLASMGRSSRALRREVYIVPAPPGSDFDQTGFSMGDGDTGVYFRGERGDNILIGNAEPECDELEWVEDPDSIDDVLSDDGFELHALRTARRVKGTPIPLQKSGLVSMYDATPDWTPIYDRSDLDGFYLACGTSGNQFKNAPVAGHVMAELITAVEAGLDHDAEPLLVTGRYTGLPIDLGTFTRNRVVPDDTHMNVFG